MMASTAMVLVFQKCLTSDTEIGSSLHKCQNKEGCPSTDIFLFLLYCCHIDNYVVGLYNLS